MLPLNSRDMAIAIKTDLSCGLVPFMKGNPGIGKSAMMRAIAKEANLLLVIVHMSMHEPTDVNGMPDISGTNAVFKTFEQFPTANQSPPINPETKEPYAGWLLFLDEFNSASTETQAACYSLVLDHKVGQQPLHPQCYIVCAGNLKTDNAIVNQQSSAITSRVVNYELVFDPATFLEDVVVKFKWNKYVAGYLEYKPAAIHAFDPEFAEDPYACPRTWDMLQQRIQFQEDNQVPWEILDKDGVVEDSGVGFSAKPRHNVAAAEGLVGQELGREFMAFVRTFGQIPATADIIRDPIGMPIPASRGLQFATIIQLRHDTDHKNLADVYPYVERFEPEFRVAFLREMLHNPEKGVTRSHQVIQDAQRNLRKR